MQACQYRHPTLKEKSMAKENDKGKGNKGSDKGNDKNKDKNKNKSKGKSSKSK